MTKHAVSLKMVPGLLGFEEISEYLLEAIADNPFFYRLEANDGPAFILTKPNFFFPDYSLQVERNSLSNIEVEEKDPDVYLIVTVPEKTIDMTANLLAPLFINEEKGLATQLVLANTTYTTKHFLFPPETRRHCG